MSHVIPETSFPLGELAPSSIVDAQVAAPHGQPCPACGSPVEPLDKFCPACGTPNASTTLPPAAPPTTAPPIAAESPIPGELVAPGTAAETPVERHDLQKYFRCQQCGSEVGMDLNQRSYACPFCDSTYVAEFAPEATGRQRPEFVIGFAVTAQEAQTRFQHWIADNGWFRPGDLAMNAVADKMRGVYLPFWSFTMLAQSVWRADIGEFWYRTETYTTTDASGKTETRTRQVRETEWWPLAGRHHRFYAGYLVSGSRGLSQAVADQIQPYNLPALRRYEPYFLAGWLCEEYSVDSQAALEVCRQEFFRREQSNIGAFLPGDTHRSLDVETQFSQISSDLCLLPVYVLSYHYRGKLFRFLVNGQTGKYWGDKPVSWGRIWIAIGVGAAVVAAIVAIILTLAGIFSR
ncbi:MAG: zinc ribbon domain-containing protein [Pirellulales bacterium]